MRMEHWFLILLALVLGYALRGVWTQPATMLGLP